MVLRGGVWRALLLSVLVSLSLSGGCGRRGHDGQAPQRLSLGEQAYYALRVGGQVMGYSTYRVTGREAQGQRECFTVESQTVLRVDVAGQAQTLDYRACTLLADDLTPQRYELTIRRSGEVPAQVVATRQQGAWQLSASAGSLQRQKTIPLAEATYLLDHNLYEHYLFLLRSASLEPGEERRVRVLVPQDLTSLEVVLSAGQATQEIVVGERKESCLPVTLSGEQLPRMTLWLAPDGELLRLDLPGQGLLVERSDERVVGQVRGIPLATLLAGKSVPSNVEFSAYWNVTRLRARLEVKVIGEPVDPALLTDGRQGFEGTVEDGWVRGVVETRRVSYALDQAPAYPVQGGVGTDLAVYLQAEEDIEAGDPAIVAKAHQLAAGAQTTWQAARAIGEWVHRNIAYEVTASGARACLGTRQGDCGPQTRLGIPARMVGGLMYFDGRFGQHYWAEVHLGRAGWVPIDAMAGEIGALDAAHIRLWQTGTLEELSIVVLDYEDRGLVAGPPPRRDLGLGVGERYAYRFLIEGQEIGEHTWQVLGLDAGSGQQVFHLRAHLDLEPTRPGVDERRLLLDGDLWVDAQARPQRYHARAQVDDEAALIEVGFGESGAHAEVTAHGQQVVRDVPLPPGTYLLANNMVGWFALLYRSLELQPGQALVAPVYFAESLRAQAVHLNVGQEWATVVVGGRDYSCLVVEVPEFGQRDYVTAGGLLVRMTVPAQDVVIDLVPG